MDEIIPNLQMKLQDSQTQHVTYFQMKIQMSQMKLLVSQMKIQDSQMKLLVSQMKLQLSFTHHLARETSNLSVF